MKDAERVLIACIRAVLCNESLSCTAEELLSCLNLAHEHGIAHLLYYAVAKMPSEQRPEPSQSGLLKRLAYAASTRELLQQKNLDTILERFEREEIRVLPLKGAILKFLYPKPEYRHMSDMDLLIDPTQAEVVRKCLEDLEFRVVKYDAGNTDLYISPEGLNFELHRDLSNEGVNPQTVSFLSALLHTTVPAGGYSYVRDLPPEQHFAYVICHIAKHLLNGGIGIRPIMDVWICRKYMKFDPQKLSQLLDRLKLSDFAAKVEHLAEFWFGTGEQNDLDDELGTYILGSGAFGTEQQRVTDRMLKAENKNRFFYLFRRLFPDYTTMCRHFPKLKKFPVFLPIFWIYRWLRAAFTSRTKLSAEIEAVRITDQDSLQQRSAFYERCGLSIYRKE